MSRNMITSTLGADRPELKAKIVWPPLMVAVQMVEVKVKVEFVKQTELFTFGLSSIAIALYDSLHRATNMTCKGNYLLFLELQLAVKKGWREYHRN